MEITLTCAAAAAALNPVSVSAPIVTVLLMLTNHTVLPDSLLTGIVGDLAGRASGAVPLDTTERAAAMQLDCAAVEPDAVELPAVESDAAELLAPELLHPAMASDAAAITTAIAVIRLDVSATRLP